MKTLTLFFVLLTFAFFYSGCNDMNSIEPMGETVQQDGNSVPFKGNWEGMTFMTSETGRLIECQGNCTHLGLYSANVTYDVTYNYPPPYTTGGGLVNGAATMTAANGDKLYLGNLEGEWSFADFPPTKVDFTAGGDIVGGTGRFAGATGHFSGSGTQNFYLTEPLRPQEVWFSWINGSIQY